MSIPTVRFGLRLVSNEGWARSVAADALLAVIFSDVFGQFTTYQVNRKRQQAPRRDISKLKAPLLRTRILEGRLDVLELFSDSASPAMTLSLTEPRRDAGGIAVGASRMHVSWATPTSSPDLVKWRDELLSMSADLGTRYAGIEWDPSSRPKSTFRAPAMVSPQYIYYAERVMLFGPHEVQRFGEAFLLEAPVASAVQVPRSGAVLLTAEPHSLDAKAGDTPACVSRLYEYLMSNPVAGVLG